LHTGCAGGPTYQCREGHGARRQHAPAKTPSAIVHKLHDEIEKALQLPEVRKKLATLGVEEQLLTVEQFDKFVSDDMAATLKLAKIAHLEPED